MHEPYRSPRRRMLALVLSLALVQLLAWLAPPLPAARGIAGYVPLHTVLETAAVVLAVLVAAIGWGAPEHQRPGNFTLLAGVFAGVAALDLLHTLSFKGMPDFISPSSPEKAINFWLMARAVAAAGLLAVALMPWQARRGRALRNPSVVVTALVVALGAWLGLWHEDWLPSTFIEGRGLTPLKVGSEYLLIALYLAAAGLFWRRMQRPQPFDVVGLFGATVVMAMSELFFTMYADVADIYNLLGHVYKVVGYGLLGHSLFVHSVREPFRRLAEANAALAEANQALAGSELRFRDLTAMASDWYWEQDAEFRFTLITGRLRDRGLRPVAVLGLRRWELPYAGIGDADWAAHRRVLERHEAFDDLVFQQQEADGEWRWCSISGKPLFDDQGRFIGYRGVGRDIHDQVEAQALLRRLNAELEARVAARTAELGAARDEAERASRAKSDFLSSMSHELRTPLNAILGFGRLLLSDTAQPLPARQRGHVRQVLAAGTHLLSLISEVLDLSRIEAGKLPLSTEPVLLAPLVEDCLSLMLPLARERGVSLVLDAPPTSEACVQADPTRLRQVLLNLLSNAIKYNRPGGRVGLACAGEAAGWSIAVRDSGAGLSAEQQRQLFQPFERLAADQAVVEGTGIGLALSQRLVLLMGGQIMVDSALGEGSTFRVLLPRAEAPQAPAAPAQRLATEPPDPQQAAASSGGPAPAPRTVLYVEDNPINTLLMEALLEGRPDLRLVTAALPTLGLDMARTQSPALLLLDIQLPGMSGYDMLRRLREDPATAAIPAVAISANATADDLARGRDAGFAAYLTKPLDIDVLLQTIDALLDLRAAH